MARLSDRDRRIRQRLKGDLEHYAVKCLSIRTESGAFERLRLNRTQLYVHERLEAQKRDTGRVRALILKGRQQGVSTYVSARFYHRVTHSKGTRVFILTHEDPATQNLFDMVNRYHEDCPDLVRPATGNANAKELIFPGLGSGYKVGTAGSKGVGRSSTIQLFHWSEVAHSPNAEAHAAGILQAVPDLPGTEIIFESTANGMGNYFHQKWRDAETGASDYIPIFAPWFWKEENQRTPPAGFHLNDEEQEYAGLHDLSLAQMAWRRAKMTDLKDPLLFKQEFPACIAAGQRVGTGRGYLPIEEVRIGDLTNSGKVSNAIKNGKKDVVRVKTKLGYETICTSGHLLSSDGEWIAAGRTFGKRISLKEPRLADNEICVGLDSLPCVCSSLRINAEFGRLLGYFCGDGSWHDGTFSICCDAKDKDVVEDVSVLISVHFGTPVTRLVGTKKGGHEVRVGSKRIREILYALGLFRSSNPHRIVKIPEAIMRSPKTVVREFLRGLFEADGFADLNARRVSIFSKHIEFLKDIQRLLLAFGITARLDSRPLTNGQGYTYQSNTLDLRGAETAAFANTIGFVSARKQSRLKSPNMNGRMPRPIEFVDEVVSIDVVGCVDVYDLTIPDAHHFDAGGILVHNCASEAFQTTGHDSFIKPELVLKARKARCGAYGPLVIGVDPARFGDDAFAVAWRIGRKVEMVERKYKLDVVQGANWIKQIIDVDRPDRVFVDVGGVGAGVVDILRSWGGKYAYLTTPINFGGEPQEPVRIATDGRRQAGPRNRRAEMWDRMRDWLSDVGGADIPDDDALQADLCGPSYSYDMNQRLVLEAKEHMRARGLASPDSADAVCLTFAEPVEHRPELFADDDYDMIDATRNKVTGY